MKHKILLSFLLASFICSVHAQKKQKPIVAYAITAVQKGQSNWSEVRLIDVSTGEEVKTIYESSQDIERFNARTGKPIVKKDVLNNVAKVEKVAKMDDGTPVIIRKTDGDNTVIMVRKIRTEGVKVQTDKPFATNSAACAYDKKHERLYYTPMGINQLRYIDLKSKTSKAYYFEDEDFGPLKSSRDVPKQITRMVIGADGNGYALTNDANNLLRFTTKKKPEITDLGALTDDPSNGSFSVHNQNGYGGDMIGDASGDFYLITANRLIFKIDLKTRVATFKGAIQGLPKGYTTNGAIAEGETTVIVNSSNSTQGYYRFDLRTLQAEKISTGGPVFNASDLANGTLVSEKKKKDQKQEEIKQVVQPEVLTQTEKRSAQEILGQGAVSVYPNPVTEGFFRLSFTNQPSGRYQVELTDMDGRLISSRAVTINNKMQVEEFRLPRLIAGGNYLVKVAGEGNNFAATSKIVVQ